MTFYVCRNVICHTHHSYDTASVKAVLSYLGIKSRILRSHDLQVHIPMCDLCTETGREHMQNVRCLSTMGTHLAFLMHFLYPSVEIKHNIELL